MVPITQATEQYETWLGQYLVLLPADLAVKHTRMAGDLFSFLRATYYRWVELWPETCAALVDAPQVLSVGDLHVENFGTWRDGEGRLVWGINDFDEAAPLPYTNDLVRLAASANMSLVADHLGVPFHHACESLLEGYHEGLAAPMPFVLAEHHARLRDLAMHILDDRDPTRFWQHLEALPTVEEAVPVAARDAIASQLPAPGLGYRVVHRFAGLGSLGRQRWLALADWRGAKVAREAKPLAPPASTWLEARSQRHVTTNGGGSRGRKARDEGNGTGDVPPLFYEELLAKAARAPDPFCQLREGWIVRRLAPDCCRIELGTLPEAGDALHLLKAMGKEAANVHGGGGEAATTAIQQDLARRPADWLPAAARAMVEAITLDWQEWKAAP